MPNLDCRNPYPKERRATLPRSEADGSQLISGSSPASKGEHIANIVECLAWLGVPTSAKRRRLGPARISKRSSGTSQRSANAASASFISAIIANAP
jgi:hypothetical protein